MEMAVDQLWSKFEEIAMAADWIDGSIDRFNTKQI